MHYRIPTLQPQTAAVAVAGTVAYNPTANGMIIYSGATLGRPQMNNNFKRIDSNGICAQQVSPFFQADPQRHQQQKAFAEKKAISHTNFYITS